MPWKQTPPPFSIISSSRHRSLTCTHTYFSLLFSLPLSFSSPSLSLYHVLIHLFPLSIFTSLIWFLPFLSSPLLFPSFACLLLVSSIDLIQFRARFTVTGWKRTDTARCFLMHCKAITIFNLAVHQLLLRFSI